MTTNVINHRKFSLAFGQARTTAAHAAEGKLVFVVGPSGAGKSTLRKALSEALYGPPGKWRNNEILLVSVRATNSDSGYFSSKDFTSRLLGALDDPFRGGLSGDAAAAVANGTASEVQQFLAEPLWTSMRINTTETKMRRAFESLGKARGLKAVLIDEGGSMCLTHSNRSPSDHLESLKCLAEEMGILIYIFGTYDLLDVWNHSAQLNRRTHLIHLSRYDFSIDADQAEFFALLRMLGEAMELEDFRVLGQHVEEIHAWTYGVVGEIDALFERASIHAYAEGADKVAWSHIETAAYTPAQLKRLADEIAYGEAMIRGSVPRKPLAHTKSRDAKRGKRPGRRNPVRDRCGDANENGAASTK